MKEPTFTSIAVRAGLVAPDMLAEFHKWGLAHNAPKGPVPMDKETLLQQIEAALDSEDAILLRETDLSVLQQYLATQKVGVLEVFDPEPVSIQVIYGLLGTGELVLPWSSESVEELMLQPTTYVIATDGTKYYFSDVRELFYGDTKSFMVCTVARKEAPNG